MSAIIVKDLNLKYRFVRSMSLKSEVLKMFSKRERSARVQEIQALKNVSMEIAHGETIGLIGGNGAGKSTLLKTIAGIYKPDSGDINTNTAKISLLALGAGFLSELSGVENVYLNGLALGMTKNEIDEKFDEIHSFSEIGDAIHNPLKTYSAGMRARLAFSIASSVDPDILLIDEVLGVGDEHFKIKSSNRIKEMINSDKTVLIVSHSLKTIEELCDRVFWLEEGKLVAYGSPSEILKSYKEFSKGANVK